MNLAGLVTDPYNRRARLQPALLALLPVGLVARSSISRSGIKICNTPWHCGIFWRRDLAHPSWTRAWKTVGAKAFSIFGNGIPSASMLRHRDARLNTITKERYHTFLSVNVPNLKIPGVDEESRDPSASRRHLRISKRLAFEGHTGQRSIQTHIRRKHELRFSQEFLGLAAYCIGSRYWADCSHSGAHPYLIRISKHPSQRQAWRHSLLSQWWAFIW